MGSGMQGAHRNTNESLALIFNNQGLTNCESFRSRTPVHEGITMAKKAKVKTVDRAQLKNGVYAATFNDAGSVTASAAQFFPDFSGFNEVQKGLIVNGLSQKLNDSHAGAESAEQALDWTKQTLETLVAGKWSTRVPGEGGPKGGEFARAYAEFKSLTVEQARDAIADAVEKNTDEDTTEKAAYAQVKAATLKKYPAIGDIIARYKAESASKRDTIEVDL